MTIWVIFIIEVLTIFFSSRYIFKTFFIILFVFLRSQRLAIGFLSAFFLPGVVLHELSHLLTAEVLGVRTHGIEFFPELQNGRLKMGSVQVEHSDFLRQFLIGVAPLINGIGVLLIAFYLLFVNFTISTAFSSLLNFVISILVIYCVFVITNTMFSSKKDMDGALELCILLIVLVIAGILTSYMVGFHIENVFFSVINDRGIEKILTIIVQYLSIPLALNFVALFLASVVLKKRGIHISR